MRYLLLVAVALALAVFLATCEVNGAEPMQVLRGSSASQASTSRAPRIQTVVAGRHLWVIDRRTGQLRSCRTRRTSNVGGRRIECTSGNLGSHGRSFGPNWRH